MRTWNKQKAAAKAILQLAGFKRRAIGGHQHLREYLATVLDALASNDYAGAT